MTEEVFNYKKVLNPEHLRCVTIKSNKMQCREKVTKVVNDNRYYCEVHFNIEHAKAKANKIKISNADEVKLEGK